MCCQYWPASKEKDERYGEIYIGVEKEEELANFHIRTFRLYKMKNNVSNYDEYVIGLLMKILITGANRRTKFVAISLHRMAQSHVSFFQCNFGVSKTCSLSRW